MPFGWGHKRPSVTPILEAGNLLIQSERAAQITRLQGQMSMHEVEADELDRPAFQRNVGRISEWREHLKEQQLATAYTNLQDAGEKDRREATSTVQPFMTTQTLEVLWEKEGKGDVVVVEVEATGSDPGNELCWTGDLPTREGFYYFRPIGSADRSDWGVVWIVQRSGILWIQARKPLAAASRQVEWAGPLPEPHGDSQAV
jgi:hypothetical protein